MTIKPGEEPGRRLPLERFGMVTLLSRQSGLLRCMSCDAFARQCPMLAGELRRGA